MNILVLLLILTVDFSITSKYGQERSKITYQNPKYLSDASTFTWRARRRDSYRTNFTVTTKHSWGNNVTFQLLYNMQANKIDFDWRSRMCDIFKHKWVTDFFKTFSNYDTIKCPLRPGTYAFSNVEIGTKYLPIPLPSGVNVITLSFCVTETKEKIVEGSIVLHVK